MQDKDHVQNHEGLLAGFKLGSVEQLREELRAAHSVGLVKDLWKYGDDHLAASHYRWWWEFVRVGANDPEISAQLAADEASSEKFQSIVLDFNPDHDDFADWWQHQGRDLFKEVAVPYIDPKEIRIDEHHGIATPIVVMEVPLNISRDLLRKQFDAIIDHYYPKDFMRHSASTAKRKIMPAKKDRIFDFAYLLSVWRTKREDQGMPFWEVHCIAVNDERLRNMLRNQSNTSDERQELTKKAERAFNQADELVRNALIGLFPDDRMFQQKKRVGAKEQSKKKPKAKSAK